MNDSAISYISLVLKGVVEHICIYWFEQFISIIWKATPGTSKERLL